MAHDGDPENQTNIASNEQTPLLDDHQSDQDRDEDPDQKGPEKKRASWYIWRIFWAIVAALILAVFIKGWIDAGGDVDVGSTT
jgi:uncharacterized membrane protein YraQ (UPF0718 family)